MNAVGARLEATQRRGLKLRLADWPALLLAVLCVVSLYELRFDLIFDEAGEHNEYRQPYIGNITTGDLALAVAGLYYLARRDFRRFLRHSGRTIPGAAAAALSAVLLAVPLGMPGPLAANFKQSFQFVFNLLVVLPVFAFAVASSRDPLRFCRRLCVFYVAAFWAGVALFYQWNSTFILRSGGGLRVVPNMALDALQYLALAYGVMALTWRTSLKDRLFGFICVATFLAAALIGASRTLFVAFIAVAFLIPVVHLLANGKHRVILYTLGGVGVLGGTYRLIFGGISERILVRTDGFGDSVRLELLSRGLSELAASPQFLLCGLGWDASGIHNFTIQTLADAGVFASALFCVLLFSPAWALWRSHRRAPRQCLLGLGLLVGFIIQYSLNALPALRVFWIPFALAVGLSLRWMMLAAKSPVPSSAPLTR